MRILLKSILLLALGACASAQTHPSQVFRISGTVVNAATGQPIPQARVRLSLPQESEEAEVVIATDAGRFQFEGLPAGKYVLSSGKPGFLIQAFNEHENYSTAVAVGPELNTENLIFRLRAEAIISGQITDEQDEPVTEAQVLLFENALRDGQRTLVPRDQTTTDDRGMYRFGGLTPAPYFIAVVARPWYAQYMQYPPPVNAGGGQPDTPDKASPADLTYPITYYPGTSDATGATPLTLTSGDRLSGDMRLVAVPALHLHVRSPRLIPNQGFGAVLTPIGFNGMSLRMPIPIQTNMSNPGEIDIGGVAPGQYHLQLIFPGQQTTSFEQDISVETNTDIDATTITATDISGIVRLQDGSPLPPGAAVILRNRSSFSIAGQAQVSQNGEFRFDQNTILPSGAYEIRVFSSTRDIMVQTVTANGANVVGRTLEIAGSNPVRLVIQMAGGLGRVTGTAVSAGESKPFAGAMILLVPENLESNTALIRRDQSDSDGTFTLPSILPGHYTLLAIQNGWDLEWMNPAVLKPYLNQGQSVDVQKNGSYHLQVPVH